MKRNLTLAIFGLMAVMVTAASAQTTLQNGVPISNISGSTGSQLYYMIYVSSGQSKLEVKISGGTGDCDLYVKYGAWPTTSSYDYRPYLSGNNETVTANNPASGYWYIMLRGYSAYSGVTLVATYSTSTTVTTLSNNVPIYNTAGATGSQLYYRIYVQSGQIKLEIKISGGIGDCDLYVKYGATPTTTSYDYRPYLGGNNETVTVNNPASGYWYIMLRGYSAYSGVTLVAYYQATSTLPNAPSSLTASRVSSSQINLSWIDNASNESGFYIERASTSSGPWTQVATVGANVTSYSNTGLSCGTTYYYRVRAYNGAGTSGYSNTAGATTTACTTVTTLQNNVPVSNLTGASSSQVYYKISVPSGQDKLTIKISGGSGDCDLYVKRGALPTTSSYDYRPYLSGNNETVTVSSPASGDWYIMLRGYSAYSGVKLLAVYQINYALVLDSTSLPALKVGVPVTVRGTIKRNGLAVPNLTFGLHDGIRLQSYLLTTDATGRFAFTSTPLAAKEAVVEYLAGGIVFASTSYQVLPSSGSNPSSLAARELRFLNSTSRTCKLRVTSPFGNVLNYTVSPGQTQTLVTRTGPVFTFQPTAYGGVFGTVGLGVLDVTGTMTVDTSGVATWQVTAGGASVCCGFLLSQRLSWTTALAGLLEELSAQVQEQKSAQTFALERVDLASQVGQVAVL